MKGASSLALLSSDGTKYERIQEDGAFGFWLPDSSGALYANAAGELRLWDAESRESRKVLELPQGKVIDGSISPDARWLYLGVVTRTADIWVADLGSEQDGS